MLYDICIDNCCCVLTAVALPVIEFFSPLSVISRTLCWLNCNMNVAVQIHEARSSSLHLCWLCWLLFRRIFFVCSTAFHLTCEHVVFKRLKCDFVRLFQELRELSFYLESSLRYLSMYIFFVMMLCTNNALSQYNVLLSLLLKLPASRWWWTANVQFFRFVRCKPYFRSSLQTDDIITIFVHLYTIHWWSTLR